MLHTFIRQQGAPGLGFLGVGLSAVGTLDGVSWLAFLGAVVAAVAVLALTIWQNESNDRLLKQAEVIASQAMKIETLVTGGEGFAVLEFSPIHQNVYQFVACNPGDGPLYEIGAEIFDATLASATRNFTGCRQQLVIGNLIAHSAKPTSAVVTLSQQAAEQNYNIFFNARNGFWTQLIRFRKVGDQWFWASRIDGRSAGSPPLHESIPIEYPRNESGGVDWN